MPEDKIKLERENIRKKFDHIPSLEISEKNENIKEIEKETKKDEEYITKARPPLSSIKKDKGVDEDEKRIGQIEKILSDDLDDVYINMDEKLQQNFKKIGEKTAKKINQLLKETKIKIKQIINLIKKWLKMIPGANKFFIEQESKIKCDELLKL